MDWPAKIPHADDVHANWCASDVSTDKIVFYSLRPRSVNDHDLSKHSRQLLLICASTVALAGQHYTDVMIWYTQIPRQTWQLLSWVHGTSFMCIKCLNVDNANLNMMQNWRVKCQMSQIVHYSKRAWWRYVYSRAQHPTQHITGHFGDNHIQSLNWGKNVFVTKHLARTSKTSTFRAVGWREMDHAASPLPALCFETRCHWLSVTRPWHLLVSAAD